MQSIPKTLQILGEKRVETGRKSSDENLLYCTTACNIIMHMLKLQRKNMFSKIGEHHSDQESYILHKIHAENSENKYTKSILFYKSWTNAENKHPQNE